MGHGKVRIGQSTFSASQVGTLFGCGYKTMLELYDQFLGRRQEEPTEEALKSMEFGTFFEEAVARWYAEKNGVKLRRCGETAYWADDMPFFICHPDRLVIGKDADGRRIALEIKCVSPYAEGWGEEGTQDIPDVYYFQVQSYYACEVPCDLVKVVCMRGNRIYVYDIPRDDDVVAEIRRRVRETDFKFRQHIVPNSESFEDAQRHFGPRVRQDAEGIGANDHVMGIYGRLIKLHYDKKRIEDQEEDLKKDLIEELGENPSFVATEDGKVRRIAYWTKTTRTRFDRLRFDGDHPDVDLDEYEEELSTPCFRVSYPRTTKGDK